jgi:hypothetical protein
MNFMKFFVLTFLACSCASEVPRFSIDRTCDYRTQNVLRNPRYKGRTRLAPRLLLGEFRKLGPGIQSCYELHREKLGVEEFNSCLIVGVDASGVRDFHHFSSEELILENDFKECVEAATRILPFEQLGRNYLAIQNIRFHYK